MRWYVYALAYPDGRIFYIGKGTGNRILAHEQEARRGVPSRKCDIIRAIWVSGAQVEKIKLAFFDTNEEALAYESSLIFSLDGLANIQEGRKRIREILLTSGDSDDFGGHLCQWRDDGTAFWDAREVAEFLGYITWESFRQVMRRAKRVAQSAGWTEQEHFRPARKRIRTGLRSHRFIADYQLSREAFWLVVQNADPLKSVVMFGKSVLAMQIAILDSPPHQDQQSRLDDSRDAGYRGLYGGLTEDDIRALKGLPAGEELLNWMGPEELADNRFCITQARAKLRREQVRGRQQINQMCFEVGRKVRQTIAELGGTMPEDLPTPSESIKRLQQKEQRHLQQGPQLPLFDVTDLG